MTSAVLSQLRSAPLSMSLVDTTPPPFMPDYSLARETAPHFGSDVESDLSHATTRSSFDQASSSQSMNSERRHSFEHKMREELQPDALVSRRYWQHIPQHLAATVQDSLSMPLPAQINNDEQLVASLMAGAQLRDRSHSTNGHHAAIPAAHVQRAASYPTVDQRQLEREVQYMQDQQQQQSHFLLQQQLEQQRQHLLHQQQQAQLQQQAIKHQEQEWWAATPFMQTVCIMNQPLASTRSMQSPRQRPHSHPLQQQMLQSSSYPAHDPLYTVSSSCYELQALENKVFESFVGLGGPQPHR